MIINSITSTKLKKKTFFQSIHILVYFKFYIKNKITNLLQMENEFK
jgi:hypothetical protein